MAGPRIDRRRGCGEPLPEVEYDIDVSVLVPARNCRPYLDRCLTSLLIQRVDKEIVVVDDGSTDGSLELLRLYQAQHAGVLKVIRRPYPQGAGRARNVALAHARGRYIYFCDADDHLGPEALERMLAMADRNGSDIVLGKMVGHGRRAPLSMFRENLDRAPLGDSPVYNSLSCFKLFRREMVERHRIRFAEDTDIGEDILFTAHAYCHAEVISVVADYECYHLVARPDGSSIMQRPQSRDPVNWMRMIRRPIELMVRHVEPGPLRDQLLRRHFRLDVLPQLGAPFLDAGEVQRKEIVAEVTEFSERWLTDGVRERLGRLDRERLASLADIDRLVRLARVEAAVVRRGLTEVSWAGDRMIVSGRIRLDGVEPPACGEFALVLRPRPPHRQGVGDLVCPATREGVEFTATVEAARVPSGVFDVYVAVRCEGITRLARLGVTGESWPRRPEHRLVGAAVVMPYFTRVHGNLSIDVGGHVVGVPAAVRLTRVRWAPGCRLLLEGEVRVGAAAPDTGTACRLVWRERHSGRERRTPVTVRAGGRFTVRPGVGWFRSGTWDAHLELEFGGPLGLFRVEVERDAVVPPRRWWIGPLRRTARPYATATRTSRGGLAVVVRSTTPRSVLKRILR